MVSYNLDWKKRWDILICCFVLYNAFSIPFELAFQNNMEMTDGINWAVDAFFIIDILVGFRTSFIDKDGHEILDGWNVAKNYLKTQFTIDLIASIPIDYIAREGFNNDDPNL